MRKKNILLTGASGTVGLEVLKQLIDVDRYSIVAFDKKSKKSVKKLNSFKNKVHLIFGDLTKISDLNALVDIDVTIHLGAIIPPLADELPALARKVNIEGTRNLIRQLERTSPNAFLMYSSSISVYGDRTKDPFIQVGDALLPSVGDAYADTKIAAEQLVKESQLNWTIFRLAAIMGNHKMSKLMFHQP